MPRHAQAPTQISWNATAPHGQNRLHAKWWENILRWLGHSPAPERENRWPTSESHTEPEPARWTPEESRILQRYHARNLAAARRATEHLVREGWHTGPVPYGYRPQRIRISAAGHPHRYRTRLVIEPVEASVVKMIFLWRVQDTLEIEEIVARLNGARYPAPIRASAPEPRGWTDGIVVAILANPKYTGYQVWTHPPRIPNAVRTLGVVRPVGTPTRDRHRDLPCRTTTLATRTTRLRAGWTDRASGLADT